MTPGHGIGLTQGSASKQPMTTKENILVLHEELEGLKLQLDGLSDGLCSPGGDTAAGAAASPHVRGRPSPHAMTLSSDELRPVAEDPSDSASSPRQPTPMRARMDAATGVTPTRLFGDDDVASMALERDAALSAEAAAKRALVKATADAEAEMKALREALMDQQQLAESATAVTLQVTECLRRRHLHSFTRLNPSSFLRARDCQADSQRCSHGVEHLTT
jgi:hypothetical protein